ncbi:hypothetical protein [Streptomyces sp. Root1310]|uniref:hypothetical protein n=1 Tax=Streptomyces sp. Root1310 TaxID=1736452 RepID=UPI00070F32D0|nr:hypothetical protein [Streptomyces sp. Root1310]KQX65274.1 hypothetical protein ASD48_19615 [Streptomyces sp. Root1310]
MKISTRKIPRTSPETSDLVTRGIEMALAAWLVATLLSQHPNRVFDRLRPMSFIGNLIPNWRFFAPLPARHDFHVLYRTLTTSGEQSEWKAASSITPRSWSHTVWFPKRRGEKAVFDLCFNLDAARGKRVELEKTVEFALLRGCVARSIEENDPVWPQLSGFQFLIVRHSGYDTSQAPEYMFASPFIEVPAEVAQAS